MKFEKQVINIIFDAGKGEAPVASREAVSGEPFGALPRPKRSGYRFVGWLLNGELVREDTLLLAEEDIQLVAQWEKAKRTKKLSMFKRQKIAVVALSVLCVLLIATLLVVNELITWDVKELENVRIVDGVQVVDVYYVKYVDGMYQLFDKDDKAVTKNLDGYYIVAGGNQYKVDPATGEYSLYAAVDIEGNESIGTNASQCTCSLNKNYIQILSCRTVSCCKAGKTPAANDKIIFLSYFDIFRISHITNLSLSYIITKHSVQYSTITKTLLFYNSFFYIALVVIHYYHSFVNTFFTFP